MPISPPNAFPALGRHRKLILGVFVAIIGIGAVCLFLWPSKHSAEREEGLSLARSGQFDSAMPALIQYLDQQPNDVEVLRELVLGMVQKHASDVEVDYYAQRWCQSAPADGEPHRVRFEILQRLSRPLEAIAVGERLLVISPFDDRARHELLTLYYSIGKYDDARRECLRLQDSSSLPAAAVQLWLARVELARGELRAAAEIVDRILQRQPDEPVASLLRGLIHAQAGEHAQAVTVLRRVRPQSRQERVVVLHALGTALMRNGEEGEAKKRFQELARVSDAELFMSDAAHRKHDKTYQMRAANALFAVDDFRDASMVLELLHSHTLPDRESLSLLAKCYAGMGRAGEARVTQERAALLPEPSKQ